VLAALGEGRSIAHLRRSLAAPDRRTRANALEALLTLPQRRLVEPIRPLLEARYAVDEPVARPAAGAAELAAILAAAGRSDDRWIRLGAARAARALDTAPAGARAGAPAALSAIGARSQPSPTEDEMERVVLLKRVPLFRYLPLDTLLAVSRGLEQRRYIDGETILEADGLWEHFCLVETGAVDRTFAGGAPERLVAPTHFGELVLADERMPAPRVVAVGDCSLLRLHRIVFHDLSRDYPDMLAELCKLLARRLRRAEERGRS
jgi:hypothetical protein